MFQLFRRRRPMLSAAAVVFAVLYATELAAQTAFVPYFGKNRIRYDNFQWHIYTTDHFQIYYYPELEQHLERVAGYAESAYQHVSTELKHDLGAKVPLVLFKTQAEFQQQNVIPSEIPEGVAAFAEPTRDRMVLPIDEPPDQLYRLITHELTHIFEFDIIPRGLVQRGIPLWVDEGLADYMAGVWNPIDLMMVRDVAVADIVPKMTEFEGYGGVGQPPPRLQPRARLLRVHRVEVGQGRRPAVHLLAAQDGHRRRHHAVRGSLPHQGRRVRPAVREVPEGSLQDVPRPRAAGRLRPQPGPGRPQDEVHRACYSIEPSPSGDLFAGVSGNRKDQEMDIVLISAKDGQVHPQPDARLRQGPRLRVHRRARRAVEHRAVDELVAGRRPPRLLRPHREAALADRPERRHRQDRGARRAEGGRRAGVARLVAGRQVDLLLGAEERHRRHLVDRSRDQGADQPDPGRLRRLLADRVAGRQVGGLPGPRQRQQQDLPARPRDPRQDAADVRHARRRRRRSISTTTRWCSRRRRSIRPGR